MPGHKTRPEDNAHCFTGVGKPFWLMEARGFTRGDVTRGPDGTKIAYGLDSDGFAMQNGGMAAPQETAMPPGAYFRFFGSQKRNMYGEAACMAGGWWIDDNTYFRIRGWANARNMSLARAAQSLIAVPGGWHDCAYVGRARLDRTLRAYVGLGKPATNSKSPHNIERDRNSDPIIMAPQHLQIKQWFVPGDRDLLSRFFQVEVVKHVIAKGAAI